jgi:polysaccharide export outer membrane protein
MISNISLRKQSVSTVFTSLWIAIALCAVLVAPPVRAAAAPAAAPVETYQLALLSIGDSVSIQVYGQPDMTTTVYVDEDGAINVPLAGRVPVAGLTTVDAGKAIEMALVTGQYLINPHVTVTVLQSHSQKITIVGEVRTPGRYPMESTATVIDMIAMAGGTTENAASTVYILRADDHGGSTRVPVDLRGLSAGVGTLATPALQGGDSIVVPHAEHYYVYGEVLTPNMYRLEPGLTVLQAISRAGGITARGSEHRVEIKRAGKNGRYVVTHANLGDIVQVDDVIRVKESIF